MFAFIVRRIAGLVVVLFAISVMTFLIFFATPGIDPSRQLAGRNPDPATVAAVKHQFGLDRPLPVRYTLMMKRLFISRDLVSYGNQALNVVPPITSENVTGDRRRPADGQLQGIDHRPVTHDPGVDRDLDAGVLARRGREPAHAAPHALLAASALRVGA